MMEKIKEFFAGIRDSFSRKMGGIFTKEELSDFQKAKLLHEYHTFIDLNKDGVLEWNDFDEARKQICRLSGWKEGGDKYVKTKQVFKDIWRYLQDDGDQDLDGKITTEEWINMWEQFHKNYLARRKEKNYDESDEKLPDWLERYIEYKFDLYDRAGDGEIDSEEFEYVLGDFGVPAKDARNAFILFSLNHERHVDVTYFRQLCIQYYRSDDPSDVGNFITGRLEF